jgi:hypothetical protein
MCCGVCLYNFLWTRVDVDDSWCRPAWRVGLGCWGSRGEGCIHKLCRCLVLRDFSGPPPPVLTVPGSHRWGQGLPQRAAVFPSAHRVGDGCGVSPGRPVVDMALGLRHGSPPIGTAPKTKCKGTIRPKRRQNLLSSVCEPTTRPQATNYGSRSTVWSDPLAPPWTHGGCGT